ncbi:MAG: polyphosphate kinase 1 [Marinilabiliales bacterium]|nr:MAG: polyphosphate kinase 1 [Marinilabiliales bacterium]
MKRKIRDDKTLYVNRELSWLDFNERVLQEAADPEKPLLERVRFLGIFSNNQDEFFRVRVATLKRVIKYKKLSKKAFGRPEDPKKILEEISKRIVAQQARLNGIFQGIRIELKKEGINLINEKELRFRTHKDYVVEYFRQKLRPHIFPIMMKNYNVDCDLRDKSIYLAIEMKVEEVSEQIDYSLIEIPAESLSRFLVLPEYNGKQYVMFIDDVIRYNLHEIYASLHYSHFRAFTIKFTRDAELDLDNDISKSFLEQMADSLKQRKSGNPVRYVVDKEIPEEMFRYVSRKIGITAHDTVVMGGRYHNFKDLMSFPTFGKDNLEFSPMPAISHERLDKCESIFDELKKKDVMLNFPYQSFQYVIDFLREASIDPQVRSIKMTIYRIGSDSNIMNALIGAARNGKKVTVFMELQARFDEQNNIRWSTKLQDEGVRVIQSIPGLKVHAKLILVRRKESRRDLYYTNVGTGNFHESTAKVYGDTSIMTADQRIGREVYKVFEMFEASYRNFIFSHLVVSPMGMRNFINRTLNNLIVAAREGKKAHAIIKLNNIVDDEVTERLYQAAEKGVKLDILIRGMCVLQPINDNIKIRSIVGRYLEHARVLYFNIDGTESIYITSADWMTRNLDHRIEVMSPVYDEDAKALLKEMLLIQLKDNVKSRYVNGEKNNKFYTKGKRKVSSQIEFYKYLQENKLHI